SSDLGVSIDSRVQVGIADTLLMGALGRQRVGAAASVSPPAAPVGDLPDFLHVQVQHVAGKPGDDRPGLPVVLAGRGEVTTTIEAEPLQPARDRARSEEHTSELQSRFDLVCRLLLEKKKNTIDLIFEVNHETEVIVEN